MPRLTKEYKKIILKKCKKSFVYFCENFCKIKHPNAGILDFKLFKYQKKSIKAFKRHNRVIYRKCRQSGISTLTGAYALWLAMFYPNRKVLIVSKRDEDAIGYLDRNVKFVYEYLPEWMHEIFGDPRGPGARRFDPPESYNEHKIEFFHGSDIKSLTSSKDTLRSNTASLVIIDEAAFIAEMEAMWTAGQPTLMHGGSVIVISTCVAGDSYVFTNKGIKQIKDFCVDADKFKDDYEVCNVNIKLATDNGIRESTKLYKRKLDKTLKIKTNFGTELVVHPEHVVTAHDNETINWKHCNDLRIGDYLGCSSGVDLWGDDEIEYSDVNINIKIDKDLAYQLGIILAEGYINKNYVVIASGDEEIRNKFSSDSRFNWKRDGRDTHLRYNSRGFVRFLEYIGFKKCKAPEKEIPYKLLGCSKEIVSSFISGMFDGDGFSRSRRGEVGYVSTSKKMIDLLKIILSNFGIFSNIEEREGYKKEFNLNNRSYVSDCKKHYRLIITGLNAVKFYENIGFRLNRKQKNQENCDFNWDLTPPVSKIVRKLMYKYDISISKMKKMSGVSVNKMLFHGTGRVNKFTLDKLIDVFPYDEDDIDLKKLRFISREDIRFETISSIEECYDQETYDFEVPSTEHFITNTVISHNTNGKGNWYHNTWEDAIAKENEFHPIQIPWHHMDWQLEWFDDVSSRKITLSPCRGIVKCETREDKLRYGEYKSPWLEQQYRELQEKGEPWKFRQEILMEFIGAGNTVLNQEALINLEKNVDNNYKILQRPVVYKNDSADIHGVILDFQSQLHIWETPARKTQDVVDLNGRVVTPGNPGHRYSLGADISSGEDKDYSAIEIIDVTVKRQVAELKIKCDTTDFAMMIDYLGRYYNNALVIVESTGIGKPVCQDLKGKYYYPNLFYRRLPSGKKDKKPGFPTTNASKPEIVKAITDYIGVEDDGILFKSSRLAKEASSFIHLGNGRVGNERGTNNNDDLMIAAGLSLIGIMEAMQTPDGLIPTSSKHIDEHLDEKFDVTIEDILQKGGRDLMYPIAIGSNPTISMNMDEEINRFISQMNAGVPNGNKVRGATIGRNKYFGN